VVLTNSGTLAKGDSPKPVISTFSGSNTGISAGNIPHLSQ
jgi:hypothetical protein